MIFDEVISGFRVGRGGAQALFGVRPDLTCLGKIVGGGLPLGVFGGQGEIMSAVAPEGPVYQAGTLREIRWPWRRGWLSCASWTRRLTAGWKRLAALGDRRQERAVKSGVAAHSIA